MAQTFRVEWEYLANSVRATKNFERFAKSLDARYSPSLSDRINTGLSAALLQPQDSANRYAAFLLRVEPLLDAPYSDLARSLVHARALDERRTGLKALYNISGTLAMGDLTFVADYAARVADLEGVRRAALLAAELRARDVPADGVPAGLALDESRDPYTGKAFQWVPERKSIGVTGLQRSTNRYSEFLY